MLSCCSNVFFTSSSFFSSSLDLCTAFVITPIESRGRNHTCNPITTVSSIVGGQERLPTYPPVLWPAWWIRGRTASAPETERQAAASGRPASTAHVWWWSPAFLQSFLFQSASQSAALASLWGGNRSSLFTWDFIQTTADTIFSILQFQNQESRKIWEPVLSYFRGVWADTYLV